MNVYYTYGRVKGDSEKDEQTIYVRLFYGRNKIQVKASTQLKIAKNGWNFKSGEEADVVDLSRNKISPQDLNHFKNIKERLSGIRDHLKNGFRVLMLSREHNTFTQVEWNDWARQQLSDALSTEKTESENAPRTLKKRENIRELLKRGSFTLDAKTPEGPIDLKWPNNKNKINARGRWAPKSTIFQHVSFLCSCPQLARPLTLKCFGKHI